MNRIKQVISFLQEVLHEWNDDKAPRLAAALAYYTVFSLAPLLVVVIAVAGIAFGQEAVRGQLDNQIQHLVGADGADLIQEMIASASRPSESALASIIGVVTLLLGAGGAFGQLQDALNTAWDVEPKKQQGGIFAMLRQRFISFGMVLAVGFLLLVSLIISTALSAVTGAFADRIPGGEEGGVLLQIINQAFSFVVIAVLFALIFKVLPDTKIEWRDVAVGAGFTALLFSIGKFLIGLYLGNSSVASSYGAAGSLIVLLLWIFYSAQILLLGAEFTQVWARRYGSHRETERPAETAQKLTVTPSKTEQRRRALTAQMVADAPIVYPQTERATVEETMQQEREKKLLTAGVISYLSALVGLFVYSKRKEQHPSRR